MNTLQGSLAYFFLAFLSYLVDFSFCFVSIFVKFRNSSLAVLYNFSLSFPASSFSSYFKDENLVIFFVS